jgi:hypothetical protein
MVSRQAWLAVGAAVLLLIAAVGGQAQEEAPAEPVSSIGVTDLAWLEGRWVGAMGDAAIEEHWSAPEGNVILGMFRLTQPLAEGADPAAPRLGFSELWTVEPGPAGPRLLLRHFSPGLVGWEDKDSPLVFEPVATGPRTITWEAQEKTGPVRLTYESPEPDTLIAKLREPDGTTPTFTYKRMD